MKNFYITALFLAFVMSGCSYFTFNATICDEIASDPHATMPKECRVYNEDEADKAFHKKDKQNFSEEDSVEFNK